MEIGISQLQCNRCSHRWIPRKREVRVCPKCHSPYWDRSRGSAVEKDRSPIQDKLDEMVRRIVKECDPEKIILFGSHAAGRAGPGSDVDLLVVTRQGATRRKQAQALYRVLWDVGLPTDIIVVRPEDFERYRDVVGTIIYPAARQGKVLYEHAA